MKCLFYHKVDWDGLLSAAIVLAHVDGEFDLFPVNYGDPILSIDELSKYEKVYVVDFSLPREYNEFLKNLVWIDHHISAIKANEDLNITGIRDLNYAACELCWRYFSGRDMPNVVKMLGEYDIFNKSGRYYPWNDILAFQMGTRTIPLTIENAKNFISPRYTVTINLIRGKAIMAYARQQEQTAFERMAWDVTLNGQPAKALLANEMSSLMCEQTLATHQADVVVLINRKDDKEFKLSVRVADGCDFDASEFCKKFGGGGHLHAAGCTISVDKFIQLYTKHTL